MVTGDLDAGERRGPQSRNHCGDGRRGGHQCGVVDRGRDAGSFSIQNGNELWFNGGANFEAKASYAVTVAVDDAAVGGTPDASQNFSLAITNVVGNSHRWPKMADRR